MELLHEVADVVARLYVFEEVGAEAADRLRRGIAAGEYEAVEGAALASAVTHHLRQWTGDPHIALAHSAETRPPDEIERSEIDEADSLAGYRARNFGFAGARVDDQNIGTLEVHLLLPLAWAADTMHAALTLVRHTRGLLLDLRSNGGGDSKMVAALAGWLLGGGVKLCSLRSRTPPHLQENWTTAPDPLSRYENEVCVLLGPGTASAAESLAFDLGRLSRATLVGAATRGAAHAICTRRLDDHFRIVMPYAEAVAPDSTPNWHQTGVSPHVECPPGDAPSVAKDIILGRRLGLV